MGVQKMAISALIERSLEVFNENSHLATWYGRPISPATDDVVNDGKRRPRRPRRGSRLSAIGKPVYEAASVPG